MALHLDALIIVLTSWSLHDDTHCCMPDTLLLTNGYPTRHIKTFCMPGKAFCSAYLSGTHFLELLQRQMHGCRWRRQMVRTVMRASRSRVLQGLQNQASQGCQNLDLPVCLDLCE